MDRLLPIEEAAGLLTVHPNTLRRWLRSGRVPGLKLAGAWRVKASTLQAIISGELVISSAKDAEPTAELGIELTGNMGDLPPDVIGD